MALELSLRGATTIPIEVEGLLPRALRGKSAGEIERWPIQHGNEKLPLAEMFHIAGDAADDRLVFQGDMRGVHWIGAHLDAGSIEVQGAAGRHAGSGMSGGELRIAGDADDWLGAELRGGLVHVAGDAADHVGAAYPGSPRGMTGGTILVHGRAGSEVAHTMRRGLIAIGGAVGDFAAINMIAGSLFIFGLCGRRPAAGMHRGTLALFGPAPQLLPTFRSAGIGRPLFMRVYLRSLGKLGFAAASDVFDSRYELFHGDLVTIGRGEILLRVA